MSMLCKLIAKCDWNGVSQRLQVAPEEASTPIPTGADETVYALHQAICSNINPVPRLVLLRMIEQFPSAIDLNAFIGACQNPRLSRDSIELLFDYASTETYQDVKCNAGVYITMAVKRKNTAPVEVFIERFSSLLKSPLRIINADTCELGSNVLALACKFGTAEMVEKIIAAGLRRKVGKSGGLFIKTHNNKDALDIAIELYDEKDDERRDILIKCVQYANAIKMGMKTPDPNYSVILAAVGLVPRSILGSFLKLYAHEITNTNQGGKYAMIKAIHMSMKEKEGDQELPAIFRSEILIKACYAGRLELVQKLLEESTRNYGKAQSPDQSVSESSRAKSDKHALEVAIDLFDENDNTRCEILRSFIQHANAAILKKNAVPSNYPTILAAVGFVPNKLILGIGKKYRRETRQLDRLGKFALKKVLKMAQEDAIYAGRLDAKKQFPLSIPIPSKKKKRPVLETIVSMAHLEIGHESVSHGSEIKLPSLGNINEDSK